MRELNECKTEILWRSAKRIEARRKMRRRVAGWGISLCLLIGVCAVVPWMPGEQESPDSALDGDSLSGDVMEGIDGIDGIDGVGGSRPPEADREYGSSNGVQMPDILDLGSADSFSFSLTWGCYGISSYDSETGKLVKTTHATDPEEYITTYRLTDRQKQQIYELVKGLNMTAYPDTYDPHGGGVASFPSMTLILSVKTDKVFKTVTAENIAYTFESKNSQGQRFLHVCKAISDILMETEEWKALPEYEHFYD
jgi:hypothetical protein